MPIIYTSTYLTHTHTRGQLAWTSFFGPKPKYPVTRKTEIETTRNRQIQNIGL